MAASTVNKWSTFDHVLQFAPHPECNIGIKLPTAGTPPWPVYTDIAAGGFVSRKYPLNDANFAPDAGQDSLISTLTSKGVAYIYGNCVQGLPGVVTTQSGTQVSTTRGNWLPMHSMRTMIRSRAAVNQYLRTISQDTSIWGTTAHSTATMDKSKICDSGFSGTGVLAAIAGLIPTGYFPYGPNNDMLADSTSEFNYTDHHKPNALVLQDIGIDFTQLDPNGSSSLNAPFYVKKIGETQPDDWRRFIGTADGMRAAKAFSILWWLTASDPSTPGNYIENNNIAIFANKNEDPGDGTGGTVGYDFTAWNPGNELPGLTDVHDAVNVLELARILQKQRGGTGGVVGTPNTGARYEMYAGTSLDSTLVQPGLNSGIEDAKVAFLDALGYFSA